MAGKGATIISLFGFLSMLLLLSKPAVSDAVTVVDCGQVISDVRPCLDYVTDKSNAPSPACCSGVKQLSNLVKTKDDRKAACECIKKAAGNTKIDPSRVLELPLKCGAPIFLPAPYSPTDIDCSKVS